MSDSRIRELERRLVDAPDDEALQEEYFRARVRAGAVRRVDWLVLLDEECALLEDLARQYRQSLEQFVDQGVIAQRGRVYEIQKGDRDVYGGGVVVPQFSCLRVFYCYNSRVGSLDVTRNRALQVLDCQHNLLTDLDVNQNKELKRLSCACNQLKKLDVSENKHLQKLHCEVNRLEILDLRSNQELHELVCTGGPELVLQLPHDHVRVWR